MSQNHKVAAINGSPHEGMGNTSQMLAMVKENLEPYGLEMEEIFLSRHRIEYCTGCATCMEKGGCWIEDDYKTVVKKVLEADAVILASPVFIQHVTAQLKTFLDRSLGYGHRPRGTWKPGLVVSVSAGWGETTVAEYLAKHLRMFGAFAVGQFTAIAVGPGEFLGREAVAARAADLARDLAAAVKEGRRYPATDRDLDFWHFMGNLIKENRELMRADHEHWQKQGLYDSFEAYIGQERTPMPQNPEMREAWIKCLMEGRKKGGEAVSQEVPAAPPRLQTLREMVETMPQTFKPAVAGDLAATYQFEISGSETFTAHLRIENQQATSHDGPAAKPDVIVRAPAEVWRAVMLGEIDGAQALMRGKYRAEGNMSLLLKLKAMFT
jgi:multimeric flavodoxin WrbA/putative sterol carrier protein